MRKMLFVLTVAFAGVVAAVPVGATQTAPHKVFVCKYVGKPFVDERLQTGQNPIDVDVAAIPLDPVQVGSYFADQHGRSYVLAFDTGQPDPDVSECPPPAGPEETTTTTATTLPGGEETTTTVDTGPGITVHGATGATGDTIIDTDFGQTTVFGQPTGSTELPRTGKSSTLVLVLTGALMLLAGLGLALRRPNR